MNDIRVAIGLLGLVLLAAMVAGCTQETHATPQHVEFSIGDPALVKTQFESIEACVQFRDRFIVATVLSGHEVPRPIRCN